VAVGCLDLRRFESFNLRYGYDRGDDLLEWLGRPAGRWPPLLPGTFVGRLGSDDFVVVADPGVMRELATGFEARYLEGIDGFYDPADVGLAGIDVVDDRGRARREPLLSFSFGAALSSELVTPHPKALLELAVERSRSLRLRPATPSPSAPPPDGLVGFAHAARDWRRGLSRSHSGQNFA